MERSVNPKEQILTVSEITAQIKDLLESVFTGVWISGEVSNLTRPQSGHVYFTLKDEHAQIRAVMWSSATRRLRFDLQNGIEIVCRGNVEVYGPRGAYQLIAQTAEPKGLGALQLAFRQLHDRLKAKGYFDPSLKKPLPAFPKRIAFVTSPTGAAIRDFLQVLSRRWTQAELLIIPARVQGEGAAQEIARGINLANRMKNPPDVLVVGRGGGSMEDLWCFNEEPVVQAIFESKIPVVSSVGHEIDVTLSDLAADLRALTPSEAAERVVPSKDELAANLASFPNRLRSSLVSQLRSARQHLNTLAESRVLKKPYDLIHDSYRRLDENQLRLQRVAELNLAQQKNRIDAIAGKLESISPLSVLARGYSITTKSGTDQPLLNAETIAAGDELRTRLHQGTLVSRVEQVIPQQETRNASESERGIP